VPSAEAIQEVSIVTNSYNAEQGLAGGAAINVVIKSGTNDSAARPGATTTTARARAQLLSTSPTEPDDTLNQFGANLGGPIVKDELFFFANWERTQRYNSSPTRTYSLAPPTCARATSAHGRHHLRPGLEPDPALRTPFPGNRIPSNRIDPAAVEHDRRMPDPTRPGYVDNYVAQGEGVYKRDNIDAKLNFQASRACRCSRATRTRLSDIIDPSSLGEAGGDALNGGQVGNAPGRTHVAGIGGTYTFGPNVLLDANVGYTRQKLGAENVDIDTNFGLDVLHIPARTARPPAGRHPSFQINNWPTSATRTRETRSSSRQAVRGVREPAVDEERARVAVRLRLPEPAAQPLPAAGRHLPDGARHVPVQRQLDAPAERAGAGRPALQHVGGLPARPAERRRQGGAAAHSRTRSACRRTRSTRRTPGRPRATDRELRACAGSTTPVPTRDVGGVSRFDPADGNVYTGGWVTCRSTPAPAAGSGQFLPRLGLAYRLGEKTVMRGGLRPQRRPEAVHRLPQRVPHQLRLVAPGGPVQRVTNAFVPVTTLRQGLDEAAFGRKPDLTQGVIRLPAGAGTTTFPKEDERKYVQSWNLMFQRELADGFTAQVGYVGTRVQGQQGFVNINASAPGTGNAGRPLARFGILTDINMIRPVGDANYHALQTELSGLDDPRAGGRRVHAVAREELPGQRRQPAHPVARGAAFDLNYGLAGFDRTHNLQTYWVWDLPFGKGRRFAEGGIGNILFGGWQVNGLLSVMSGQPINIIQGNAGNLERGRQRPVSPTR
jgi:hypothetical protein